MQFVATCSLPEGVLTNLKPLVLGSLQKGLLSCFSLAAMFPGKSRDASARKNSLQREWHAPIHCMCKVAAACRISTKCFINTLQHRIFLCHNPLLCCLANSVTLTEGRTSTIAKCRRDAQPSEFEPYIQKEVKAFPDQERTEEKRAWAEKINDTKPPKL